MANVKLQIKVDNPALWQELLPKLMYYAEEADLRLDTGQSLNTTGDAIGITMKTSAAHATKFFNVLDKIGLSEVVKLHAELILPQDDSEEKEVQSKLYPGGDTSMRPPKPTDRQLPSSNLFSMSLEQYAEYMHGMGGPRIKS